MLLLAASISLLALKAYGQRGLVQTFFPASIPLAVRTPYLSTWHNATSGQHPLTSSSPVFWTQQVRSRYPIHISHRILKHDLGDYGVDWQHQGGQHLLFLARSRCTSEQPEGYNTAYECAGHTNSIYICDDGGSDECHCHISVPYRGESICPSCVQIFTDHTRSLRIW